MHNIVCNPSRLLCFGGYEPPTKFSKGDHERGSGGFTKNQYIGGKEEGGVFEGELIPQCTLCIAFHVLKQDGTAILKNVKTNFVCRRTLVESYE